ncbi:5-formyltetrahydrofolate cyclo-ligase [Kineococcus sp. SYSU DK006]|uniref:5-formyltetrahydrofolate cyclo-ligase n=1 Tax=Kineococcus sp. SYSU DK006 TaxID=3383127 RepID=UPI003D7E46B1
MATTADTTADTALTLSPDVLEVQARKARLRRDVRADRRTRDARAAAAVEADLARVLLGCPLLAGAGRIACYSSLPGEPGTGALLAELHRHGVQVLLPHRTADDDLDWHRAGGAAGEGAGAEALLGPEAVAAVDLVVVPALAVDTAGRRLGQGGGSYDRALRRVPARVPVLAVVHDEELLDAAITPLPSLPHDRLVHAVVTPTRWLWLAA